MKIARLLFLIPIAALAGCQPHSQPPAASDRSSPTARIDMTNATDALLREHIGQRITVAGDWAGNGKLSGYVYGDRNRLPIVYVKAIDEAGLKKQTDLEKVESGTSVEVTGVLHWYEPPPEPTGDTRPRAMPPRHFYFDVDEANVKFLLSQ
jgi:hypothetical protein